MPAYAHGGFTGTFNTTRASAQTWIGRGFRVCSVCSNRLFVKWAFGTIHVSWLINNFIYFSVDMFSTSIIAEYKFIWLAAVAPEEGLPPARAAGNRHFHHRLPAASLGGWRVQVYPGAAPPSPVAAATPAPPSALQWRPAR